VAYLQIKEFVHTPGGRASTFPSTPDQTRSWLPHRRRFLQITCNAQLACVLTQCIYIVICNYCVLIVLEKVTLRDMQFYRIRRVTTDDSTTKNTRLLDREFIPKT